MKYTWIGFFLIALTAMNANAQGALEAEHARCVKESAKVDSLIKGREDAAAAIAQRRREFEKNRSRLSQQEIKKFERDEKIFLGGLSLSQDSLFDSLPMSVVQCWARLVKQTDLYDAEAASAFERFDKKGGGFGVLGLKYWQKPEGQKQAARYFLKIPSAEVRANLNALASPEVLQCFATDDRPSCLKSCEQVQGPAGEKQRQVACALGVQKTTRLCSDQRDLDALN